MLILKKEGKVNRKNEHKSVHANKYAIEISTGRLLKKDTITGMNAFNVDFREFYVFVAFIGPTAFE